MPIANDWIDARKIARLPLYIYSIYPVGATAWTVGNQILLINGERVISYEE